MPQTIRLHASGAVETFQFTDEPGGFPDATIVGVAPQWDDASDATYARSQTDVDSSDFRSVTARLDPLPAIYGVDLVESITIHMRYDTAHPSGETIRGFRFAIYDDAERSSLNNYVYSVSSTVVDLPDPPDDDLIHEVDYTIYPSGGPFIDAAAVVGALQGGAWLNPQTLLRSPWQRNALTVYEAWVDVVVAATPVLRQLRRRDGLGQASVRRLGNQSVTRVIGGQP